MARCTERLPPYAPSHVASLAIATGAAALVTASESLLTDRSPSRGVAAAALVATLVVDGLFLLMGALTPGLSGII